jgi:hypothetical protein
VAVLVAAVLAVDAPPPPPPQALLLREVPAEAGDSDAASSEPCPP